MNTPRHDTAREALSIRDALYRVRRSIADRNILLEYAEAYKDAQEHASVQIWASIQRNQGDPRWKYEGKL